MQRRTTTSLGSRRTRPRMRSRPRSTRPSVRSKSTKKLDPKDKVEISRLEAIRDNLIDPALRGRCHALPLEP